MAHTGLVRALVLYNAIKNLIRIGTFFLTPFPPRGFGVDRRVRPCARGRAYIRPTVPPRCRKHTYGIVTSPSTSRTVDTFSGFIIFGLFGPPTSSAWKCRQKCFDIGKHARQLAR